jgi:hypothetical protein
MCQFRKKQVPGWNLIVYLNEKKLDLEVGIDVYDVPAPKKIRFLTGIQLCTLTKKTWSWKLDSMCTMGQPRKKQVHGWNPIVYLNEKKLDLDVGIDVYDVPAPKNQVPGWNPIVYLNDKKLDFEVGIDVYDVPVSKKKNQVPGWNPIVYLNEKKLDLEVGIDVYDVPALKKTGPWLDSNCVP